uniref:Putative Formiminoglutamate deiminase hutF n=1 Tax=mine drainage metagenome TaxID=410659 RepID=E6PZ34_9ZZZZ
MSRLYIPDLLLADGQTRAGVGLQVNDRGCVEGIFDAKSASDSIPTQRLPGRILTPGLANAHSHGFQRLFRGRAEGRAVGGDTFWTWREQMYRAAGFVGPEELYDVARAVFLEMVQAGITLVGEFHYLHRDRDGRAYSDPNLLSEQMIRAARSVGLRICLLRSGYFRAGFERAPHAGQARFYEQPGEYLKNLGELAERHRATDGVSVGAAPHSIRAVPLVEMEKIVGWAREHGDLPVHLHISEQVGENAACVVEYGATPVALLAGRGLLDRRTTLIHAIHLSETEFEQVASAGTTICSCPTTERNLGDGIFPAEIAAQMGIPVTFGSDSQAQIEPFEDARQLEYHLRLRDQQRGILDGAARADWKDREPIGAALLRSATSRGYTALGVNGGALRVGEAADFITLDMDDLSLLGAEVGSLAEQVVFAGSRAAVREVFVQGKCILRDGAHPEATEIRERYRTVQARYAGEGSR